MTFDFNTALLSLNLVLLAWIKKDQFDLWKRVNNHRHEAECDDKKCRVKIDGVLIGEK